MRLNLPNPHSGAVSQGAQVRLTNYGRIRVTPTDTRGLSSLLQQGLELRAQKNAQDATVAGREFVLTHDQEIQEAISRPDAEKALKQLVRTSEVPFYAHPKFQMEVWRSAGRSLVGRMQADLAQARTAVNHFTEDGEPIQDRTGQDEEQMFTSVWAKYANSSLLSNDFALQEISPSYQRLRDEFMMSVRQDRLKEQATNTVASLTTELSTRFMGLARSGDVTEDLQGITDYVDKIYQANVPQPGLVAYEALQQAVRRAQNEYGPERALDILDRADENLRINGNRFSEDSRTALEFLALTKSLEEDTMTEAKEELQKLQVEEELSRARAKDIYRDKLLDAHRTPGLSISAARAEAEDLIMADDSIVNKGAARDSLRTYYDSLLNTSPTDPALRRNLDALARTGQLTPEILDSYAESLHPDDRIILEELVKETGDAAVQLKKRPIYADTLERLRTGVQLSGVPLGINERLAEDAAGIEQRFRAKAVTAYGQHRNDPAALDAAIESAATSARTELSQLRLKRDGDFKTVLNDFSKALTTFDHDTAHEVLKRAAEEGLAPPTFFTSYHEAVEQQRLMIQNLPTINNREWTRALQELELELAPPGSGVEAGSPEFLIRLEDRVAELKTQMADWLQTPAAQRAGTALPGLWNDQLRRVMAERTLSDATPEQKIVARSESPEEGQASTQFVQGIETAYTKGGKIEKQTIQALFADLPEDVTKYWLGATLRKGWTGSRRFWTDRKTGVQNYARVQLQEQILRMDPERQLNALALTSVEVQDALKGVWERPRFKAVDIKVSPLEPRNTYLVETGEPLSISLDGLDVFKAPLFNSVTALDKWFRDHDSDTDAEMTQLLKLHNLENTESDRLYLRNHQLRLVKLLR
jgi:hypothetical protein